MLRLMAISEHYFPRVGGTVNYLHETLSALVRGGVQVELYVPGPEPARWLPKGMAPPPYQVVWVDAGYPAKGDPDREARYAFCRRMNETALAIARGPEAPHILHVVFGLFLMEVLDTGSLRSSGLPTVATVHNVPPQECRMVAHDAPWTARLKEELRLAVVGWKNRARLRAHRFDGLVVPSQQVHDRLRPLLAGQNIDIIGHGPTSDLLAEMILPATRRPAVGAPLRLLTAGGFAPHKRQHIIPQIASRLSANGIDFRWDVVGPAGRVRGYFEAIEAAVRKAQLEGMVNVRSAVPFDELAQLYDNANLYLQPSMEEGFCITALDAAAAGIPVIASPAGALARITRASGGTLVESAPEPLARAITDFVNRDRWGNAVTQAKAVRDKFSWDVAAQALQARYGILTCRQHAHA